MGIKLREKKLNNGCSSLYLDIHHNSKRKYEFLDIHLSNKRKDSKQDKERRDLAEKIRSQREYELIIKDNNLTDKKKQLADFLQYYEYLVYNDKKASKLWKSSLFHLKNYTGKERTIRFIDITEAWLTGYQNYLLSKVSNNSAVNYMRCMIVSLNVAVEQRIIQNNPYRTIPREKKLRKNEVERNFLTIEEIEQLAKTKTKINRQIRLSFLFSCFTGLRWSDVNKLKWQEIEKIRENENQTWAIHFKQKKTKTIEFMPLSQQAIIILEERQAELELKKVKSEKETTYIFPFITEDPGKEAKAGRVLYYLKKWGKQAGLKKHLHFHVGRHTFATMALTYGADLYTVSKLLGHKQIQSTTVYAKIIDKKKNEAVANLPLIG